MGRGVSSGGGKSSLGYLFGSDVPPRTRPNNRAPACVQPQQSADMRHQDKMEKPAAGKVYDDGGGTSLDMSGGGNNTLMGRNNNNYYRADGQNSGNFITVSLLAYVSLLSMGIFSSQLGSQSGRAKSIFRNHDHRALKCSKGRELQELFNAGALITPGAKSPSRRG